MRREQEVIEQPVQRRALIDLHVPSIPLKLIGGSETGWPDDVFLIPGGRPLILEFKWPGEHLDPKQVYMIFVLLNLGYEVEVHDNVEEALTAIAAAKTRAAEVGAASVHATRREILAGTRMCRFIPRSGPAQDVYNTGSVQFLKETRRRR